MRAIGYYQPQPIHSADALVELTLPKPEPAGRDLLVEIRAISVNPVDVKLRAGATPPAGTARILGFDAAGIVTATGPEATLFRPGDAVFYAGAINRQGANAEYQLVDERIVGRKPQNLDFADAAALPLTGITAWEALFDRLDVSRPVPGAAEAILIIGGAGGVGSIAIQLSRILTPLTVIATASRPETESWCRDLGAHHVIDHNRPLADQIAALGIAPPAFVFSTNGSERHLADIAALIAPQGRLALIDDPDSLDVALLKSKSLSLHWEFMFARSLHQTADIEAQHRLLNEIATLVEAGRLRSTRSEYGGSLSVGNLKNAHRRVETGQMRGKIVLSGFEPE